MTSNHWDQIPDDLRYIPQWCIAAPDKSPYTLSGVRASVTNPAHWADWYSASVTGAAWGEGAGIGFVLSEDDDFTCIDLDVKDGTPQQDLDRFWKIVQSFNSYTEYSVSGRGLHIWVRGKVGQGCRRGGVEVYSQQRFIICTGNALPGYAKPVEHRQELLDLLVSEIRAAGDRAEIELEETDAQLTDEQLWQKAAAADNGDKFATLFAGDWQGLGYPSQSEADLALLSILCFYSKSNEQIRRVFRLSELGKRAKAIRNNTYIDRTLQLIRTRQHREDQAAIVAQQAAVQLVARAAPVELLPVVPETTLDWPPGIVGSLARWMYSIAPRPVREVAIVSALGVVAGMYGRNYNVSGSGLNLYIVLVARSAIGKEAMHSSISKLIHILIGSQAVSFSGFIDFNDYASGPALIKSVSNSDFGSVVNVAGEWGRKLRKMGNDDSEGAMSSLRTVMTNLYQKSSAGTIVGGIGYSDNQKNVAATNGVAYSMIGETTPDTFYESLTNTMMQDGFMSRFIVVEYAGLRPELNEVSQLPIPDDVFYSLANSSDQISRNLDNIVNVVFERDAQEAMDIFNALCDKNINATDDESWRQMWNRAHLKALKVAALLAVADNFKAPVITMDHAEWALALVHRDIKIMGRKIADGDVGEGDMVRERKMLATLSAYLREPIPPGYKLPDEMRKAGVVARKFLQIRLNRTNAFARHRGGQIMALDTTLKSLMDSGYIVEVARDKIPADWNFIGKCYRIVSLPDVS